MPKFTIDAYRGTDPNDGNDTYVATLTDADGNIQGITAVDAGKPVSDTLFESPETFDTYAAMGMIGFHKISEPAQLVLDEIKAGLFTDVWSYESEGDLNEEEAENDAE